MRRIWPIIGALVGGSIAFVIAWKIASNDMDKAGDYRDGAARFFGMVSAVGVVAGYFIGARLARGPSYKRDGFTLAYKKIEPMAAGYRDLVTITIADIVGALREIGYEPRAEGCDESGQRSGATVDPTTPLAGSNVAFSDPGVRGWIRLQLPVPVDGQARALGLLELWSSGGESTEEMGLFALRGLDSLIGGLSAARESSRLSDDPVSVITTGLAKKPRFRKS
jgi:hypothetical protein